MHEKGYSDYKTDDEIWQGIEENDDIIDDGMCAAKEHGDRYGIFYAADNISMCI